MKIKGLGAPVWGALIALLALGWGIRLFDLTDPPFDFHTTRQLRGAVIARGMYYEMLPQADPGRRELAQAFWDSVVAYEPAVLERLSAWTYLAAGQELPWIARVYNSLAWVLGALVLFALARRTARTDLPGWTALGAALFAAGYMLLQPFGVQASRAFLPDPLMVVLTVVAVYALVLWAEHKTLRYAVLVGGLAAIALLVKVTAVFVLLPAFGLLALQEYGMRQVWRRGQVWLMLLLMLLPAGVFYLGLRQNTASEYYENTTLALLGLLVRPQFYLSILNFFDSLFGFAVLVASFAGLLLAAPRLRAILLGVWLGYLPYAVMWPYQMYTHSYYHLRLVPFLALSLAPVAQVLLAQVKTNVRWWKAGLAGLALLLVLYPLWQSYATLSRFDYREQPAYWAEIGAALPQDGSILALTQDYGFPLMYYGWRKTILWPTSSDQNLSALRGHSKAFSEFFDKRRAGRAYFLVTDDEDFAEQPDLQAELYNRFPLLVESENFLLFDLQNPVDAP
ncbi:MAG TPA: glycosyltransferase family 39 protein [Anaerolineales bacterium]|nr:glycosyltransferase family 39 protein [Anaerolineales bacterium]